MKWEKIKDCCFLDLSSLKVLTIESAFSVDKNNNNRAEEVFGVVGYTSQGFRVPFTLFEAFSYADAEEWINLYFLNIKR